MYILDRSPGLSDLAAVIVSGTAFYISWWAAPGFCGLLGGVLACLMIRIALVDKEHFIIPNSLNIFAALTAIVHVCCCVPGDETLLFTLFAAASRAIAAVLVLWLVRVAYRRARGRHGLGLGDVKLAGVAALWLAAPWFLASMELAALSGIAFYVGRQLLTGMAFVAKDKIPFGSLFGPAIWLGWLLQTVSSGLLGA